MIEHNTDKRREKYEAKNLDPAEFFIVSLLTRKITAYFKHYFENNFSNKKVKLLDLGCGSQPLREKIVAHGFEYYSADIAPINGVQIDYILNFGDEIKDSSILNQKFDFIICTEVLEHVPDWKIFFSNLDLISSSDACILFTSPFIYLLHEKPYDYFRATPFAYEYYAERNNFKVEKIEQAGDFFDVMGTIAGGSGKYVTYRKGFVGSIIQILVFFLNGLDRCFFKMIRSALFKKFIKRETNYYLSNIVVLKR
jgi:hypothetical protein